MTWFKVDDKLHSHKKAARAGVAAMGLWTIAGSWCADQLTDGFVPDYIADRLAPGEAEDLAGRLVEAGLWDQGEHDGDKGWWFNDWDDYQPTREAVEEKREYERQKKRRQRRDSKGQFATSLGVSRGDNSGDIDKESPGESTRESTRTRPVPTRPQDQTLASTDVDAPPPAPPVDKQAKKKRPPDVVFDTLLEVCGLTQDQLTKNERGKVNNAVKQLKDVKATPDEIRRRAVAYRKRFDDAALTPLGLANNWSQVVAGKTAVRVSLARCEDCRQPLNDAHDADLCAAAYGKVG